MQKIKQIAPNFQQRLKVLRESFRMNKNEFANVLDITPTNLGRYEAGDTKPGLEFFEHLIAASSGMGIYINLNWLVTGMGKMEIATPDCLKLNPILTLKAQEKASEFGMDIKQYIEHLVVQDIKQNAESKQ